MKYSLHLLTFVACSIMLFSCSEHIPDEHEQLYLDTADSLKLYQNSPYLQKEIAAHQTTRDLLKLEYNAFKEKHDWNDEEMKVFADIIQGHVSIAKTINQMQSN